MPKTKAALIDEAEVVMGDTGNSIFATTDYDQAIKRSFLDFNKYVPYSTVDTIVSDGTRALDISDIVNLARVHKAEYKVDQYPRAYRNVEYITDTELEIKYGCLPTSGEYIKLHCDKFHTLVDPPSSLSGVVNLEAGYAAGSTSIVLDGLGTGTIKAGTLVRFTGYVGEYKVTTDATITANAATIVIEPSLREAIVNDTPVVFKASTLDSKLEASIVELMAAHVAINWTYDARSQFDLAITDITNAASELALANPQVDAALTESGLINPRVDQSVSDVASGRSLANTAPVGGGIGDYLGAASGELNAASGYNASSGSLMNIAQGYLATTAGHLRQAGQRLSGANFQVGLRTLGLERYNFAIRELMSMRKARVYKIHSGW